MKVVEIMGHEQQARRSIASTLLGVLFFGLALAPAPTGMFVGDQSTWEAES